MALLLPILLRLLPYLIGAAAIVGGWLYADRACWSSACKSERARVVAYELQIKAAQQRATDLALLWAKQVEATDEAVRKDRAARVQTFARLADDARRLPAGGHLAISPAARRVFDGISAAANDQPAPDPAGATEAPEAVSCIPEREAAIAWADAAESYRDATSQLEHMKAWYESLRRANGQVQ